MDGYYLMVTDFLLGLGTLETGRDDDCADVLSVVALHS